MSKLALTNLLLLLAIKSVSACSYAPGYEPPQLEKVDGIYFLSAFALMAPIVFLYFLRERKGQWALITSAVSLVLFIPALFFTALTFAMCGGFVTPVQMLIRAELFLMLLIFTIQLFSWISQKRTATKLR
jgi:hypothetical protein